MDGQLTGDGGWDVVDMAGLTGFRGVDVVGFRRLDGAGLDRRVVPHCDVTLVFELSGGLIHLETDHVRRSSARFVAGLSTIPIQIRASTVDCIEIRMSPVTAFSVLGLDLGSIAGQPYELEDLWGMSARELHDRLVDTTTWSQRAMVVASALERRRAIERRVDPEVATAWDSIIQSRGTVQVNQLVRQSGWSRKRLWSRFSTQIGLSPKRAAMLARFQHASNRLIGGAGPAEVAAECGYVDQSHLHRDVVSFARCTPSQLAAESASAVAV